MQNKNKLPKENKEVNIATAGSNWAELSRAQRPFCQ